MNKASRSRSVTDLGIRSLHPVASNYDKRESFQEKAVRGRVLVALHV